MKISALRTIDASIEGAQQIREAISTGELGSQFGNAISLLLNSKGRLIVMGVGKSGHIGRKLAATFASTGTRAYFVHAAEASHGDLGMIDKSDIILAISWSGETAELSSMVSYAKRFAVPLIAITANSHSSLARAANVNLALPRVREACPNGLAPTTSTQMQLMIGDALAVALLEARGFSAHDFRVYHPGGKLGAQLSNVKDVMHDGARMPLVKTGQLMADAVTAMTSFGFGVAGVIDENGILVGIITDGDLRRHVSSQVLEEPVELVMSKAPKTISPDILAGDALKILEDTKISVLFVCEDSKPVGIIHILDLLRIGVA